MRIWMSACVVMGLVTFGTACGDDIAGDWFRCQGDDCLVLADDGLRLREDQTFVALESSGSTLDADEIYCELTSPTANGTYELEGELLTTRPVSGNPETVTFRPEGDAATMVVREQTYRWLRIDPRSVGPCAENRRP